MYRSSINTNIKSILNIAGGKKYPIGLKEIESYFLLNVDLGYRYNITNAENIDSKYLLWADQIDEFENVPNKQTFFIYENIYEYLDETMIPFNLVTMYRFLEHVPQEKVLFFIYQLSRVIPKDGMVDCIVPNFKHLANLITMEQPDDIKDRAKNIYLTTELFNDASSPHLSLWTGDRIKYYWELEKRFEIQHMDTMYEFDQRPYIRALIKRI